MLVQCLKQDRFPGSQAMAQQALGTATKCGAGGRGAADATRVPRLGAAQSLSGDTAREPRASHSFSCEDQPPSQQLPQLQGTEPACQGNQQGPISNFIKLNVFFGRTFPF